MASENNLNTVFEIAAENRRFELEMFWRRTLIFWGFLAALFIGVATVAEKQPSVAFALANVGWLFSITFESHFNCLRTYATSLFFLFTIIYIVYCLVFCRSRVKIIDIQERFRKKTSLKKTSSGQHS